MRRTSIVWPLRSLPTGRDCAALRKDCRSSWDAQTLRSGLNFTLKTDLGDIDVLGEVTGLGGYDAVAALASEQDVAGLRLAVLSLDGLERAKRAAGRVKDLMDLEEIAEIRRQSQK